MGSRSPSKPCFFSSSEHGQTMGGGGKPFQWDLFFNLILKTVRPNITIFFTILAVGVSFAWLGVEDPARWRAGVVLYVLGCK